MAILDALKGKAVCIIGGGPAETIPACDIYISANEHGAAYADFVVAVDDVHGGSRKPMREHIRAFTDAPLIGPYPEADIHIKGWPGYPERLYSGITGIYFASEWGAKEIHLAGFSDIIGQRRQFDMIRPCLKCPVHGIFNG